MENDSLRTLDQVLTDYLKSYDLGVSAGGYDDNWAKVKILPFFMVPVPNIKARREAVKIHDVNHILTQYSPGHLKGEIEIACFELGTGCGRYWFAWAINLAGLVFVPLWFSSCWTAFRRGRRAISLYINPHLIDEFRHRPVEDLRLMLKIEPQSKII